MKDGEVLRLERPNQPDTNVSAEPRARVEIKAATVKENTSTDEAVEKEIRYNRSKNFRIQKG